MSIGRAQAVLLRDKFLDDLGIDPSEHGLPIIERILKEAAAEFIDNAEANLLSADAVTTGALQTQLAFAVNILGDTYSMVVGYPKGSEGAKYYDFNNKGVQGVKQPGKAPNSPYKFRYLGVSPRHALAILKWYRHNGKGAGNIHKEYAVSGLETKRVTLRQSIKQSNDLASLAYATAMKSKIEGIKPTGFFDKATDSVFHNPDLYDALAVALSGDVILQIRKYEDKN